MPIRSLGYRVTRRPLRGYCDAVGRGLRPFFGALVGQNPLPIRPAASFMYAAFFLLPITFYGLFNPVVTLSSEDQTFIYVLVFALIRTGTTFFEVPSTALLPDLEQDYDGETNGWRYVMHLAGPAVMAFT